MILDIFHMVMGLKILISRYLMLYDPAEVYNVAGKVWYEHIFADLRLIFRKHEALAWQTLGHLLGKLAPNYRKFIFYCHRWGRIDTLNLYVENSFTTEIQ